MCGRLFVSVRVCAPVGIRERFRILDVLIRFADVSGLLRPLPVSDVRSAALSAEGCAGSEVRPGAAGWVGCGGFAPTAGVCWLMLPVV